MCEMISCKTEKVRKPAPNLTFSILIGAFICKLASMNCLETRLPWTHDHGAGGSDVSQVVSRELPLHRPAGSLDKAGPRLAQVGGPRDQHVVQDRLKQVDNILEAGRFPDSKKYFERALRSY